MLDPERDQMIPKKDGGGGGGGVAGTSPLWALFKGARVQTMMSSVDLMGPNLRALFFYEAFLYYSPILFMAFMLFLWGINLWGFSHSRVSYPKVFDLDPNHLTHREIWRVAAGLSVVVLSSMASYLYLYAHGAIALAASQPVLLYCALPLVLALPFDFLYAPSRYFFLNTLFRLTFPLQPITFADFFVADVLTSMAKVLSDVERSVCRMANGQVATIAWMDADDVCGSHSLMIPFILSYPYICRFFQCLRQYSDTRDKTVLLNALKYTTAFPVILLSATKYHVAPATWQMYYRPMWILSGMMNTCYSFYWDIARDWDLTCFYGNCNARNPLLRPTLHFSRRWVYHLAIATNLVLRVSWTYKLSSHLRHHFMSVFIVAMFEMVRRFQWIFFRVETEWNRMLTRAEKASVGMVETGAGAGAGAGSVKDRESDQEEQIHLLSGSR